MPKDHKLHSSSDLLDLLESAKQVALEAGKALLEHYLEPEIKMIEKEDGSPLTVADLDAHHIISSKLTKKYGYFVLSEESDHTTIPSNLKIYWLIDPLDGTKDFIAKSDEFTVNIALIQDKKPILSVIYAPVFKKLYVACLPLQLAYVIDGQNQKKDLRVRPFKEDSSVIFVSRFHKKTFLEDVKKKWPTLSFEPVGSSLKFCLIAEGLGDLYIRRGPICTWDSAAGECIVRAAGGQVLTMDKDPLVYDETCLSNKSLLCFADPKTADLLLKYTKSS